MTKGLLLVKTNNWRQAFARKFMFSFCSILSVGLTATAAVRATSPVEPPVRYVEDRPAMVAVESAPVKAAPAIVKVAAAPAPAAVEPKPEAQMATELIRPVAPVQQQFASIAAPETKQLATKTRKIRMTVTAYCPCKVCCGRQAQGITASGKRVSYNGGKFVAADTDVLPFGTKLSIPGYHDARPVEVVDTGSAIQGRRLDVFFKSHRQAKEWGVKVVDVTVTEEAR